MTLRLALIVMALLIGCAADETGSATAQSSGPVPPTASAWAASPPTDSAMSSPSATTQASAAASPSAVPADPLLAAELVDVRTGASFTLGELAADGRPVLVETMAIWCTNCRAQQHEVVAAHDLADFHSVSIDVDPHERAHDLAAYADREGFDWHFVLADAELATALRDRFSPAVLNPPSMPKLLVSAGAVGMIGLNEQLSADEIATLVGG